MSLIPYYLQYLSEICEGTRQAPEGLALSEQDDLKKALHLRAGIAEMGIPACSCRSAPAPRRMAPRFPSPTTTASTPPS